MTSLFCALSLMSGPLAEVPFTIGDDAIIIEVKINGKPIHAMFDSGFSGSFVIGPHIDLGKPTGKMNLKDFVGVMQANTVKVTDLHFGALKLKHDDMEIVQLPTLDYTESYGTHVDGIMGLEVFAPYVTEINFETKKFIIYPDTFDFALEKKAGPSTFTSKMLPIGLNSIELPVKTSNGKNMVLALDTGNAFYATTHKEVLERVGLWPDGRNPQFVGRSYVASGPVETWNFLLTDAKIFGVPVAKSVWSVIDLPSSSAQHDGTIGFGFLKHFNITIDLKRRKVRLENFSGRVIDEIEAEVGIAATYSASRKQMVIVRVTPNSPAEKAGVREGDYLISIGSDDIFRSSYRSVRALLAGAEGSSVEIATSQAGQLRRLTLVRELLVNRAGAQTP